MIETKGLIEEANRYVFNLFKDKLSPDFVYHNYQHTLETVETAKKIARGYDLTEDELEVLLLAAWFHDTGYMYVYRGHEEKSKEVAAKFLNEHGYPQEKIAEVLDCIDATKREYEPDKLISKILCDSDIVQIGEPTFFTKADLLRSEWENFGIRTCDKLEWARTQLDFLLNTHFMTQRAHMLFGEQQQKNIRLQKQSLEEIEKRKKKKNKKKKGSKAQPKRGIETMFRSIYKSHINLSSIADSKANMMINIHSLIISITLTLVGAKFSLFGTSFSQNQIIILPIISLLMTSMASIIFAILSAKPNVTSNVNSIEQIKDESRSILFFGNYTNIGIREFEQQMRALMKDQDNLYGNMIRDIYFLGKVLTKKYRLLKYSYIAFLIGLITTLAVTTFVIIYLKQIDDLYLTT